MNTLTDVYKMLALTTYEYIYFKRSKLHKSVFGITAASG